MGIAAKLLNKNVRAHWQALVLSVAASCLVAMAGGACAREPMHPFSLEQLGQLSWAFDVQVAPAGARIAYLRMAYDVPSDSTTSELWVIDPDGRNNHRVDAADAGESSPVWSPGGDQLAFVGSKKDGGDTKWQIRIHDAGSHDTRVVATLAGALSELAWSPDGSRIAFAMFVPSAAAGSVAHLPESVLAGGWLDKVHVSDQLVYRLNGQGYVKKGYTHLFTVAVDRGTLTQVTHGDYNDALGGRNLTWSKDGKSLIFSAHRDDADPLHHFGRIQIYEVPAAGGEPRALTHGPGMHTAPTVSPDGKSVAYVGYTQQLTGVLEQTHLYVMNRDGSGQRQVLQLDRDVSDPAWGDEGLYFLYADAGVARLGYTTLSGSFRKLADIPTSFTVGDPYTYGQYSIAPQAGVFAFPLSTPESPANVAIGKLDHAGAKQAAVQQLTNLSGKVLEHTQFGKLKQMWFQSKHDGLRFQGWVLYPPNFSAHKTYPLILQIHGGPTGSYGPTFSSEDQYYAGLGYVVLYVNPRGSTSYGSKFTDLINHDFPNHDYDDLMSAVETLVASGYVDKSRMYISGLSYGGILTAWAIGHTHAFRAAAAAEIATNWYSWVLTADIGYSSVYTWFSGFPWDHLNEYMSRSPITYAGQIDTPTLIIHGGLDYLTPVDQSLQLYGALKMREVPALLVELPDVSHVVYEKPRAFIAKVGYMAGWFACFGGNTVGAHTCPYEAGGSASGHTKAHTRNAEPATAGGSRPPAPGVQ